MRVCLIPCPPPIPPQKKQKAFGGGGSSSSLSHLGGGTNIWQWWGERITPPIFTVFGPVGVDWDVTPPQKY